LTFFSILIYNLNAVISRGTISFIFVMVGIMVMLVFCEPLIIELARWM